MLGDSFTYGQGVAEEHTYPHQVAGILTERDSSRRFEVINAGSGGFNTTDELRRLRERCLQFEPDLITVQFTANDLEPVFEDESGLEAMLEHLLFYPKRSYAVFFIRHRFGSIRDRLGRSKDGPQNFVEDLGQEIDRHGPGWRAFEEAVDGLGQTGRDHDTPMVMILYPRTGLQEAARGIHLAVAERARKAGLRVIDLIDVLSPLSFDAQIVSVIDHHPSAEAHGLAARRIVEQLDAFELLPRPTD
jgi:hypothetical protein